MSSQSLSMTAAGLVTSIGLDTPNTCAAIRCAITNVQETRFRDSAGQWIQGAEVPLEEPWRGPAKLAKMLARALQECVHEDETLDLKQVPILLCLAEKDRPGRIDGLGKTILLLAQEELGLRFHPESHLIELGRVGALVALKQARTMIYDQHKSGAVNRVIIAGVDSLLDAQALRVFEEQERVLTSTNSNGFIPGEAASAIVFERASSKGPQVVCVGLGFGAEAATILSEQPLRADGLTAAIKESLTDAALSMGDVDFRIADISGEHYWFKEAALALGRLLRTHKQGFDLWHPADCVGEVGAAIGGVIMASTRHAFAKHYAPGNMVLYQSSNDDGQRGAAIFLFKTVR
jgi:3-oxoacyl-[acyl-carrier-protein] synthase-1